MPRSYFRTLLVKNFQGHAKLRIDFDRGITSIVGQTDAGKSAALRALRWVCTNTPAGGGFIRHHTTGVTVRLDLTADGVEHTIIRKRSADGTVNTYSLDGEEFRSFNRDVPEPIRLLLNTGPVCWQLQHDAPFWFGESASEVSRQLNAIVDLGIIDRTLTNTARAITTARTQLDVAEAVLAREKVNADATAWAVEAEAGVLSVEAAENAFATGRDRAAQVAGAVAGVRTCGLAVQRNADAARRGLAMAKAHDMATAKCAEATTLEKTMRKVSMATVAESLPVPDFTNVARHFERAGVIAARTGSLLRAIERVVCKEKLVCERKKSMERAGAALPKACPTCGRSL